MSNKSAPVLGELESLVLLAVLRLDGEGYGVTVREEIARRAGRSLTLGTIYKTLVRLESKGLLRTSTGAPEARRGGRRRKLYHVNAAGKRAVGHTLSTLERMAHGLDVAREAS